MTNYFANFVGKGLGRGQLATMTGSSKVSGHHKSHGRPGSFFVKAAKRLSSLWPRTRKPGPTILPTSSACPDIRSVAPGVRAKPSVHVDVSGGTDVSVNHIPPTPTRGQAPMNLMHYTAEQLNVKGIEFVNKGDVERGIECFNIALKKCPRDPRFLCNRSGAYAMLTPPKWQNSYQDAVQATRVEPLYWKAWSRRGAANLNMGNYQAALEDFLEARKQFRYHFPTEALGEALREGLLEAKRMVGSQKSDNAGSSSQPSQLPIRRDPRVDLSPHGGYEAPIQGTRRYYHWDTSDWPPRGTLGYLDWERPARCRGPNDRIGMSYKFRRR